MDSTPTPNSPPTVTQHQQRIVEFEVFNIYRDFFDLLPAAKDGRLRINRNSNIEFLTSGLRHLDASFSVLDANRPWLCYWILHSLALLRESVDDDLENNAIDFLNRCQDPDGGYGGGPRQLPHLATTYAAVNALITLGSDKALSTINRGKLYSFLLRMKDQSGGFRMHDGGEIDVRASYTAISVASVLNILDNELVQNVGDYVLSCQTYEGGIAGEPGSEAHGGYSFCGLATMILINEVHRLDLIGLMNWVAFRQGIEGGFQGRTNKLVDGCYSFWQGGALALIQRLPSIVSKQLTSSDFRGETSVDSLQSDATSEGGRGLDRTSKVNDEHYGDEVTLSNIGSNFLKLHSEGEPLFQIVALQQYILLCSQEPRGGFKDKPGKSRDYYHTCYCLSGLSLCQYSGCRGAESPPLPSAVLGPYDNLLEPVHPLYNVVLDRYHEAHEFFSG